MPQCIQIHQCRHYEAFEHKGGIIVHKRGNTQGGKYLGADYGAAVWIDAIKTAMDSLEASALCRAVLAG